MTSAEGAPYVATFGETMALLHNEVPGSLAQASELRLSVGGAESNVAIALSRLGTAASWLGRVGDDSLGERVLRELRAEGVHVRAIVDPKAATGMMLKERRTSEAQRVWYYRSGSAGSRLCTEDVSYDFVAGASLLHLTGITPALSQSAHAATLEAIRIARTRGVPISFDVNHRPSLWQGRSASTVYREIAESASIVFAGEDEARLLVPSAGDIADVAEQVAALGPKHVIIKLGDRGCYSLIDGVAHVRAAIPIRAVDTVGAGDAFVAGYLAEYLHGESVSVRLRTAVEAGAFACLSGGDWEGLPRRSELRLLFSREPVTR